VQPPDLSIVIAAHNAGAVIAASLRALTAQAGTEHSEIIVADSSTDGTPSIVDAFPSVRLLHFDQPLTVPELRGRGIAAANGRVIALLDPFSIVAEDWTRAVLSAHETYAGPVIGGAVDLHDASNQTLLTWAIYINEYGAFMPPVRRGATDLVPGCNVSYKRTALFDGDRPRFHVFWKTFVNREIQARGSPLWLVPEVVVRLWKPIPFADFLVSRFDHGRCFAALRPPRRRTWSRLCRAAGSPLLPLLLSWRFGRAFWTKRRNRRKLIATLPLQILLFGSWAAGEGCGYLRGTGRSCERLLY
jgi:glycosyltransferase involved in cell wall biosynthesis